LQLLERAGASKAIPVEEWISKQGYVRIDPSVMFLSVAQDPHSTLWHGVLLAPDNETESGFRHLSQFKEGSILPEHARNVASMIVPTVPVLMDGTYLYPHFNESEARKYEKEKYYRDEAQKRRDRRAKKRQDNNAKQHA
jgi:hypothetical protein